jgi:ADP-heptose:LPS heptosyltransferase
MAEPRRILLVRLDGIGDALACVPLLEGLRRAFPSATFGAVLSRVNAGIFSPARVRPYVFGGEDDLLHVSEEARNAGYDVAVVATEEVAGYEIARSTGAHIRVGFWHRFEKPFKSLWQRAQLTRAVYRPAARTRTPSHEAVTMYALARALGAAPEPVADAAVLRAWVNADPAGAVQDGEMTLGVQIASKLATSGWGPAALAALIDAAVAYAGLARCVLLASESEAPLARAILDHMPAAQSSSGAVRLQAPTDVPRWLGAIASLGALISPDTGAAHAAGMLGVPVVDLFDSANFAELSSRWRPWAAPTRCFAKSDWHPGLESRFGAELGSAVKELRAAAKRMPRCPPTSLKGPTSVGPREFLPSARAEVSAICWRRRLLCPHSLEHLVRK